MIFTKSEPLNLIVCEYNDPDVETYKDIRYQFNAFGHSVYAVFADTEYGEHYSVRSIEPDGTIRPMYDYIPTDADFLINDIEGIPCLFVIDHSLHGDMLYITGIIESGARIIGVTDTSGSIAEYGLYADLNPNGSYSFYGRGGIDDKMNFDIRAFTGTDTNSGFECVFNKQTVMFEVKK